MMVILADQCEGCIQSSAGFAYLSSMELPSPNSIHRRTYLSPENNKYIPATAIDSRMDRVDCNEDFGATVTFMPLPSLLQPLSKRLLSPNTFRS